MSARVEVDVPSRPVLSHSADAVAAAGLLYVAGILPLGPDVELDAVAVQRP